MADKESQKKAADKEKKNVHSLDLLTLSLVIIVQVSLLLMNSLTDFLLLYHPNDTTCSL